MAARDGHLQAREQRNDKRERILDAAVKVFAERGYFSSTVAEIARAAGVADGTIYLYFKSKDDLLFELFDEKMTQLIAQATAALAQEPDAPSRLKRFIKLHFSVVEKNPELASVLVVELRQSAQLLKAADRQKLGAAYLELIGQVVREGQERGELDPSVSAGTAKRAIFGALDELALGWLLSGRRASLKKTGQEVAEWLVRGLLPAQAGGKS
ncbi:MAG TPA: TetR/AcrR family transcriptional regulator [Myxococcales bacterium]|nr:TetR/AcrR family transcriptional regulator [Myxococcales bacterium]